MENQERHNKKIELLAKCLDAGAITLQDALFILDADIVKAPEAPEPVTSTKWNGTWNTNPYPYIGTQTAPLTGTIIGGTGSITTSNFPINSVTYTSTSTTPGETLTMHANTVGLQADTKQ